MYNCIQHGFRVWFRKNEQDALWEAMSYAPRSNYNEAQHLVEYYEGEWGKLYEYQVVPCGQRPAGMCVPYV